MRGARITGMGHYLPERVVTNDDLTELFDTSLSEGLLGSRQREIGGSDVSLNPATFPDPGALADPLVAGIEELGQVVVGDDTFREVVTHPRDSGAAHRTS